MKECTSYIYNYSSHEDEKDLCALEMRAFFGIDTQSSVMESPLCVDPSRSPFIRSRIEVMYEGNTLQEIIKQVKEIRLDKITFKVAFIKNKNLQSTHNVGFEERRRIERHVGLHIPGEPDLQNPDVLFGVMEVNGRWVFGKYVKNKAVWLQHQRKPNSYSTALSSRVARSIVNIAVPNPTGVRAIDPCCGIGNVLVEGLSMGINIEGSDVNPLVISGARENLAHFGLKGTVIKRDILDISDNYDVAIIDLPYNLCSVTTPEEQLEMLRSARQFTKRAVIITIESIDSIIRSAGWFIVDQCTIKKGRFTRYVMVCQ